MSEAETDFMFSRGFENLPDGEFDPGRVAIHKDFKRVDHNALVLAENRGVLRRGKGTVFFHVLDDMLAYCTGLMSISESELATARYAPRGYVDFSVGGGTAPIKHAGRATVIFNDTPEGAAPSVAEVGCRDWRAVFDMRHSKTLMEWLEFANGEARSPMDCGLFLDQHLGDVVEPNGSDVLKLVTQMTGSRKVEWKSGVNVADGTIQLKYVEEDAGAGQLNIPRRIIIGIPVFEGLKVATHLEVSFRYTMRDGSLKMFFEVVKFEDAHRRAVQIVCDQIKGALDIPVYQAETPAELHA